LKSPPAGIRQAQTRRLVSCMIDGLLPLFLIAADELAVNPTWSVSHA
jgi:hypothetical protein